MHAAAVSAAYASRWDDALALLARAADAGDPLARGQLDVLGGRRPGDLLDPPKLERLHADVAIGVSRGYMPDGFADWFIGKVRDSLSPALVDSARGRNVPDPSRTAMMCQLDARRRDVLTAIMQSRAAALSALPIGTHEPPNVISYETGQKYDYHGDFLNPNVPNLADELRADGQRVITIVTYLNEDFTGGETHFAMLGIRFRGATGDAIAWTNVLPDGRPDPRTVHAGLPPQSGRKWILSQWLRSQPFSGA